MKSRRSLFAKLIALAAVLVLAAVMFVIGRGHTVYFDNKAVEYEGKTYEGPYKVTVYVKGEQAAKLYDGERGMTTWVGQNFRVAFKIMQEKGGDETITEYSIKLPHGMDGIVINIPAYLAGLPEEAYLSEFVSLIPEASAEDEEIVIDEFGMGMEGIE